MNTQYRKAFLKDLKKLKGQPVYNRVYELAFTILPESPQLRGIPNVIAMQGYSNRYRIRVGNYRVGIEVDGNDVEVFRVLHRRDFYRYFP